MDRITVIKAISRNLRDLVVDTVPASMTGSSVDALALIHPLTDQLKGHTFYAYSGAGAGQERTVTSFTPANNRMTFDQVFGSIPSTNTSFALFRQFRKDEYDNVLDRMIGIARLSYLEERVATLDLVATQYEYPVPSGMEYISTLRLVPSGWKDYGADDNVARIFELTPHYWRIEPNALGTYVIVVDRRKVDLNNFDDNWVNVQGQAPPTVNATDNATVPQALEEFLINGASMLLSAERISEGNEWKAKFQIFRDMHKSLEANIYRPKYGRRVGA